MRALILGAALAAAALTPDDLLQQFAREARAADPTFTAFSAERGAELYRTEHTTRRGTTVSCATCHGADPRGVGKTRANKRIDPLAPSANSTRFTDGKTVEKWFTRNCQDVLERPCTAREKGDFLTWLRTQTGG